MKLNENLDNSNGSLSPEMWKKKKKFIQLTNIYWAVLCDWLSNQGKQKWNHPCFYGASGPLMGDAKITETKTQINIHIILWWEIF